MSKGGVLLTSIQDKLSNVLYTVLYYLAVCSWFHEFLSYLRCLQHAKCPCKIAASLVVKVKEDTCLFTVELHLYVCGWSWCILHNCAILYWVL